MAIKSWSCPSCRRDFIVDSESARDACPWCQTTVEEKDGALHALKGEPTKAESDKEPPKEAPKDAPKEAAKAGESQPAAADPAAEGAATGAGAGTGANQAWWPFEYSS